MVSKTTYSIAVIAMYLFGIRICRSYEVVAFTENGWISTATNGVHLPLIISIVGDMSIAESDPVISKQSHH